VLDHAGVQRAELEGPVAGRDDDLHAVRARDRTRDALAERDEWQHERLAAVPQRTDRNQPFVAEDVDVRSLRLE
jgi:hypothetical protein